MEIKTDLKTDLAELANIPARNRRAEQYSASEETEECEYDTQPLSFICIAMILGVLALQFAIHM